MKRSKRQKNTGFWCPVCRAPELHEALFRNDWKCRGCGSRIPKETLLTLIAERIDIIRLKVADSGGEA